MDRSIWILFPEKARKYAKNKNALFFVKNRTRYLLFLLTRPRKLERHIAARFSFGEKRGKRTRFFLLVCAVAFMLCKLKKLHKTKTNKKAAKYRTNGVSGMLGGKILFFPTFFKKWAGYGVEPHKI